MCDISSVTSDESPGSGTPGDSVTPQPSMTKNYGSSRAQKSNDVGMPAAESTNSSIVCIAR